MKRAASSGPGANRRHLPPTIVSGGIRGNSQIIASNSHRRVQNTGHVKPAPSTTSTNASKISTMTSVKNNLVVRPTARKPTPPAVAASAVDSNIVNSVVRNGEISELDYDTQETPKPRNSTSPEALDRREAEVDESSNIYNSNSSSIFYRTRSRSGSGCTGPDPINSSSIAYSQSIEGVDGGAYLSLSNLSLSLSNLSSMSGIRR